MALSFQNQGSALARRVLLVVFLVVSLTTMTVYAREGSDGVLHRAQAAVAGAVAPLRSAGAAADAAVDGAVDAAADAGADDNAAEDAARLIGSVTLHGTEHLLTPRP